MAPATTTNVRGITMPAPATPQQRRQAAAQQRHISGARCNCRHCCGTRLAGAMPSFANSWGLAPGTAACLRANATYTRAARARAGLPAPRVLAR